MFDFDAGKMMLFGIVALAVIPPKDLPRVLRTVGKYVGQVRRMATDFQGQFMDAIKEAELDSVKKEIQSINDAAKIDTSFDPSSLMRDTMAKPADPAVAEAPAAEPAPHESVTVAAEAEAAPAAEKAASSAS
ncbi:MAG: hypothetical protein KGM15_17160 [Pseudomonadota bacterium]|nr:hypothetical protein [Pseudomonadota bacterium]